MIDDGQDVHAFYSDYPDVHLEILRGRARIRNRPVRAPVYLIGKAKDCDLVLGDPQFPDLHTYLFVTQDGVTARHLGHGPGLRVSNRPHQCIDLVDGDLLRMGNYEFRIHIEFPPMTRGDDRTRTDSSHGTRPIGNRSSRRTRMQSSSPDAVRSESQQLKLFLGEDATEYVKRRMSA